MVTLLSTVCGALLKNRTAFTMSKKGFALAGSRENKSSFKGLSISYKPPSRHNSASTISIDKDSNKIPNDPLASIQLPKTLLTSHGNDQNDLIFVAYDHGKLFQEKGRSKLNSKVISAEVKDAKISDLGEPIVTKFKTSNDSQSVEQICVWWDFDLHGKMKTQMLHFRKPFKSAPGGAYKFFLVFAPELKSLIELDQFERLHFLNYCTCKHFLPSIRNFIQNPTYKVSLNIFDFSYFSLRGSATSPPHLGVAA